MENHRFDDLIRTLTTSRRSALGGALALAASRIGFFSAEARKKGRDKPKDKPKPNQYGCLEVGDACKNADQCYSGICAGKRGKRTCRAHGTGTCKQDKPGVCTATMAELPKLGCGSNCWCFRTTAGSKFCSPGVRTTDQRDCTDCQKDADCLALGYPPGSACAHVGRGNCTGWCDSGMACLVPCGTPHPE